MEEIERILIGTALTVRGAGVMICKRVTSAMFSDTGRVIFEGIKKLIERRSEINISNISAATGIEPLVFRDYVQGLHGADIDLMIDEFLKSFRIKVEYQAAIDIQIATTQKDYEQIEAIHKDRTAKLSDTFVTEVDEMSEIESWQKQLIQRVDDRANGKNTLPGITTGFLDLDLATGGSMPGELIVVGASPGVGKTSFALHLALTALGKGYRVGFISVEMSFKAILGRVIAHETGINSRDIRDGYLGKEQLDHIGKTTDRITKSPIKIINNLYNIDAISATIRDMTSRLGIQFWAVDYLQLIKGHGKDRRIEVGDIAREMMVLAKTMEVPVVLLSQLARTDNARPKMKDLKESGDIEAHAHKIILLSNDYEDTDNITVDLVKNRDGEVAAFTKRVVKSTGHWFDPNEPEQMTRPETTEDIPF